MNKGKQKYNCTKCGEVHGNWSTIAYHSPSFYTNLSAEEKENCTKSDDFCIVKDGKNTYFFIRAVLSQLVNNSKENLEYGLWVSLSKKSFDDYSDNYNNDSNETTYFGWLANNISGYDSSESIPTTVVVSKGNQRPEIFPHKSKIDNHKFIQDYYNGISQHEAQRRVDVLVRNK